MSVFTKQQRIAASVTKAENSMPANATISPGTSKVTADCLFGFTGRTLDDDTGLQNNLNRWYDPEVGRWLSEDPAGLAAGDFNLNRYCGNSPASLSDPTGLEPKFAVVILQTLARGDIKFALELLSAAGVKGASLVPRFIDKFQAGTRLADGRCADLAAKTADVFRRVGENPRILQITDKYGARFWQYRGEIMTKQGWHRVVECGGKIYDKITGPNGMEIAEYMKLLERETKVCPVTKPYP